VSQPPPPQSRVSQPPPPQPRVPRTSVALTSETKPGLYRRFRRLPVWVQTAAAVSTIGVIGVAGSQNNDDSPVRDDASTVAQLADTIVETTARTDVQTSSIAPDTSTADTAPVSTVAANTPIEPPTTVSVPLPAAPSVSVVAFGESLVIDWTDPGDVEINVVDAANNPVFALTGSARPVVVPATWLASYTVTARIIAPQGVSEPSVTPFVMPAPPPPPPAPPVQPAVDLPVESTDTRYGTCREAKANGANTPYVQGQDPEYAWYDDRDNDGVVCE
jgi:Excalibur calcium-binding domain